MATSRADALVLVVNVSGRIDGALEAVGTEQRRRPPQSVDVAHFIGDLDGFVLRDFLADQRHRKQRRQVGWPDWLACPGVEHRGGRMGQVRNEVVPMRRDLALV